MGSNTGRCWFSLKFNKWQNVNMIVAAFNSQQVLEGPPKIEHQKKSIPSLQYMCRQVLLDKNYPTLCVQLSYAFAVHQINKYLWDLYARTEIMGYVPNEDATEVESVLEYFSIPEFSIRRDQVEFRTMDYTHMLTNMCNHILTYGYEYCKKEHFVHLADNRPDILSHAFVCDKVDTQNTFFTMKMFSHPVEDYMCDEGFNETADFVQLVRHWHSTCNMRGISVDERIWKLYDMMNS